MNSDNLPKLITFDGEARSGKGTVVQATKDYLIKNGHKVMLIDAGQVFRVLVVAVTRAGVDINNPEALDNFLQDENEVQKSVQLVKEVYHMEKDQRDSLLYTNEVSASSAIIGRRPLSQEFKDNLLRKWLKDAAEEGFEVVLLDGRALEEVGSKLEDEGYCNFALGLYFICDAVVGARRTLGFASKSYEELSEEDKNSVDELVGQINSRNQADREREVQPIVPPRDSPTYRLPEKFTFNTSSGRPMAIVDTSADVSKEEMVRPVAEAILHLLRQS